MGKFKIKGVDILQYQTPIAMSENGTAHPAFSEKIRGISEELDNGSKKLVTGWELSNTDNYSLSTNYDCCEGKIKVNGQVVKVAIDGTRPRNMEQKAIISGTGATYYLNNINGVLYLSTSPNSATGTILVSSKANNKDVVINLACWGSGGKGGTGAYWFLVGNWGGVGGAGGGKAILTMVIKNNDYFKIVTETDAQKKGRITASDVEIFNSPNLYIYHSSAQEPLITCEGGKSGISNHPRWGTDDLKGAGEVIFNNLNNAPIIIRQTASGVAHKTFNGNLGVDCPFNKDYNQPSLGNIENIVGDLILVGKGGKINSVWKPSDGQMYGSGGAGSYGDGGKAADNGGNNNSAGFPGKFGGGGGGADSPAGGAEGGDGGLPGFAIFY